MYAHNDALQFSNKLTKLAGAHGLKFGFSFERGQKQQNFQNHEAGQLWFGTDNNTGTGNSGADMLVGRIGQFNQGTAGRATRRPASRTASSATGTSTRSRRTAGGSARTSRSNTACGSATGRTTRSSVRPGRLLRPGALRLDQGLVPRPRHVPARERRLLRRDGLRAGRHPREPFAVRAAARQRRVGHRRRGQQRPSRRLRPVLQPQHGQRRVRQHAPPGAQRLPGQRPTSGRAAATATASA